jgi:ABC-type uncharacterized transport system substrate-binding protein
MKIGNGQQAEGNSKKLKFILCALCALLFALCSSAHAQQPGKIPRIGYIASDSRAPTRETFRQGLRDFGYVEGETIFIEWRFAEDKLDRTPELAAELVHLNLDVIVAGNALAAKSLTQATSTIPIVMAAYAGDPVADGLVKSFAKPGGNVTGVIPLSPELSGKRLEFLKKSVPKISRMGVLWNPDSPGTRSQWEETQTAARPFGVQLLSLEVRNPNELDKAIEQARKGRVGAVIVLRDALFYRDRKQVVALIEKARIPGMYPLDDFVEAGGLMSYSPNNGAQYRRAAYFVDKILKGTQPSDLPVEGPTKFELAINLNAAKQIGLTIPQSVLFQATKVIK